METLLFYNSFGAIYTDKIFVKSSDFELNLDYIDSFKIYSVKQNIYFYFLISCAFLAIILFVLFNVLVLLLIAMFLFLISFLFYNYKIFYFKIYTKTIYDVKIFGIKKKDIDCAEIFIYEATYLKSIKKNENAVL